MIPTAIAAFIGAFAAIVLLKEFEPIRNKALKYLFAFVVGIPVVVLLAWFMRFVLRLFDQAGG